jgi:hypothetical protein
MCHGLRFRGLETGEQRAHSRVTVQREIKWVIGGGGTHRRERGEKSIQAGAGVKTMKKHVRRNAKRDIGGRVEKEGEMGEKEIPGDQVAMVGKESAE